MKQKGKRIVIIALALLLLICGGIYTAYRLHPESFVGQDEIITRGEYAAILAQEIPLDTSNAEKDPPSFSDIDGHWSEKYIEALIDAGIIDPADYPDGFHPDDPITRAEILKMLVRAEGKDEEAKNTQGHSGYDDQPDIRDEDKGYVIIGREDGIIGDTDDNKIRANDPATKGEAEDMNDKVTPKPTEPTPSAPSQTPDATTPSPAPGATDQPAPTPMNPDENQPTPTPTPTPTPAPGNPGGGSYYPPAQVRFELPETVHTDSEIQVMPVWKYMKSYTWTLTKTAVDGSQQPVELADAVSGTLGLEGGTIQFKEDGQYTLTAVAKNTRGKETVLSKQVTVYPVIDLSFDLPETTHTDKSVTLSFPLEKLYGHDIVWTATKDGEAAQPTDILSGELENEGGTYVFRNKGEYTLTASIADDTGRVFTHSKNTKVYPVAGIAFSLPAVSHTDTVLDVTTALTEAEGLTINWSLTKNGEAAAPTDELEGSLTNGGGNIRFKDRGVYMLTGTLTDEIGRTFEATDTVTVYPVGSIGFYVPEITHTDKTVHVETKFENLGDASIQWSLTRNGEAGALAEAVQGELTNEGGYIRFIDKGEYVLKAAFTDPTGRSYSYTAPVKVYPVPGITYTLPETAHTDTIVNVIPETSELGSLKVEWLLENGFGFQDFGTYVDGTLDNSGGSIRFKHAGTYELIARITDETGRVFLFENGGRIEVLPVLSISFEFPESTHTDRSIDLRTRGNNNVLPVEWSLTKDGEAIELTDVMEGSLNAYGGKIRFTQIGDYILTASMTDALGRVFSYSASTTVCPIPTINLSMPQVWYESEAGTVSVSGTDLENLTADWTVVKDDGGAEPYSIYTSGTLTKAGGSLTFLSKGQYKLTLTMTDPTGRTFTKSRGFTISPIPTMSISVTPLTYSGDAVAVTASGSELDGTDTAWLISVDGGQPKPYTQYATGTVGTGGGSLTISTDKTIAVKLIGETTNVNGRKFTFTSNTATVKPIASFPFSIPSYVHIGGNINVSLPTVSGLEGRTLTWSLTKGGSPASYSGSLSNSGGVITISVPGSYVLTASTTDSTGRAFTYSQSITITNTAPNKPTGSASVTRTALNGKLKVNISASAADPDGDAVTLEYSGNTADSYYSVGTHTVYVRAKDAWGLYSDWTPITFTVNNSAPTTPVINRTPDGNSIAPGVPITITASSSDADGDAITYIWEGRPAQTSTAYPLGKNVVRVKAVDSTGAESPWAAIVFFIADPNRGGGMTLTGPESVILEQGIAGATITNYTFTVPPVSGHSGNDYGRVRGYNVLTRQWDQMNYGTTTNGITFSRSLSPGIYSQLEFYYYTNHNCMYNKSNITYSVSFYFQ
ncbi:MAG: S-layer homology domain-containing protein [Bacillota bacterium]